MSARPEEQGGTYKIVDFDDDIHVLPYDDWFEHDPSINCPCRPYHDSKNSLEIKLGYASKYVFIHRQIKGNKKELI